MNTLRARLRLLYLSIAAVLVTFLCIVGAIVLAEIDSANQRTAMTTAARDIPPLLADYDGSIEALPAAEATLQLHFQNTGLIAHVVPKPQPPLVRFERRPPDGIIHFNRPPEPGGFSIAFNTAGPPGIVTQRIDPPLFMRFFPVRIFPERVDLRNGAVMLFPDPAHTQTLLDRYFVFAGIFALVMMLLAWRVAEIVVGHTLQPLVRTTDALNRFGDGDFTPAPVRTNDQSELGLLALAYNRAVAQITRALDERSKAEREMRQFVGDAGHQLRTPLTVVMGYLSALAPRAQDTRERNALESMLEESRRMKTLIDDLIVLAKLEHPTTTEHTTIALNDLVHEVVHSFNGIAEQRIVVTVSSSPLSIVGSTSEIFSALAALIDNALKYAGRSPIDVAGRDCGERVCIEVMDRGPGLAQADLTKVFDRFYRAESSHGVTGTGLGLAIVRRTVERANGTVSVENRDGGGLIVRLSFPKPLPTSGATVGS